MQERITQWASSFVEVIDLLCGEVNVGGANQSIHASQEVLMGQLQLADVARHGVENGGNGHDRDEGRR